MPAKSPRRPPDTQRERLYRAERAASAEIGHAHTYTLELLKAVANGIIGDPWFEERWPLVTHIEIETARGRKAGYAYATRGIITINKRTRRLDVLLHEIAHVVTYHQYGVVQSHGPEFARNYLDLVLRYMGPICAARFRHHFREKGVGIARRPSLLPVNTLR